MTQEPASACLEACSSPVPTRKGFHRRQGYQTGPVSIGWKIPCNRKTARRQTQLPGNKLEQNGLKTTLHDVTYGRRCHGYDTFLQPVLQASTGHIKKLF